MPLDFLRALCEKTPCPLWFFLSCPLWFFFVFHRGDAEKKFLMLFSCSFAKFA